MPLAGELPAPQAHALRVSLGEEAGEASDRFLVFLAALSLLAEAAETRPVLAVVDDAHWLDEASAAALLFVARRLGMERVAMLFAAREHDVRTFDAGDLPTLRLAGLDLVAGTELLRERTGAEVTPEVAAQLLASTGGNPLALVEMPHALSPGQLAGEEQLPGRLPVTGTIERVFLDRARRLSPAAQRLLLVAAADDSTQLSTVAAAAAQLGAGPEALAEAEASGLVQVQGTALVLRHPLVRSALYASATSADRRAAHAAVAAALTAPDEADRRAWHRAASVDTPDPAVVAELDAAACRAEQRGGHEAASAAWERAAELSDDPEARARRWYGAAHGAWLAGQPPRARQLADRVVELTQDPLLRADALLVRAKVEWNTGSVPVGQRMLLENARDVATHDPVRALGMATIAAGLAAFVGDPDVDIDPATFAAEAAEEGPAPLRCFAQLTLGLRRVVARDWKGADSLLRRSFDTAEQLGGHDSDLLTNLGLAALHLGDTRATEHYFQRVITQARGSGAVMVVLHTLSLAALSDIPNGRWSTAVAQQSEAVELGLETGQPALAAMPRAALLLLAALRGDDAYEAHLVELERTLEGHSSGVGDVVVHDLTRWARGLHAAPRWPTAFHHLAQVVHPIVQRTAGLDRVEAAVHADQQETARLWIEDLEEFADATGQRWAAAMAAHGRAVLSVAGDDADSHFEQALALHADSVRPFDRARTELAYGEHLRRTRRRVAAREHLRAALETFEDLRADRWVARAAQELRASGETARKRDDGAGVELTPTELQVAQLVQGGMSNREVAAQLFVSPRTVDFHLRNVFAKTGVTSRLELAQLALA
jgi:DNA-binding NarL/FixJ family response regulator